MGNLICKEFPGGFDLCLGVVGKIEPEGSGDRFSKDTVTYRARKVILKTMIRLPSKLALLMFQIKEKTK